MRLRRHPDIDHARYVEAAMRKIFSRRCRDAIGFHARDEITPAQRRVFHLAACGHVARLLDSRLFERPVRRKRCLVVRAASDRDLALCFG